MGVVPPYSVEQTFGKTEWIYFDGAFVPWDDARLHVLSAVVQYGSGVFEGIRAYNAGTHMTIFRLHDHLQRLLDSARAYYMDIGMTTNQIAEICVELIRRNKGLGTYLRPNIFRGYGELGVNVLPCRPQLSVAYWNWGKYLGADALERGVRLEISPFRRMSPDVLPPTVKAAVNYGNGQLAKAHALMNGFADAIMLDRDGCICEGTGMNLFFVRDDVLWTPPVSSCILEGYTRDAIIWLAGEIGIRVREEPIPMMFFHRCQEVFATGSASEVTPVVEIDRAVIGDGTPGSLTMLLQQSFSNLISQRPNPRLGRVIAPPEASWLTRVTLEAPAPVTA